MLIVSEGDRSSASLASLGGTGVFATALRDALLAGEVDAVVHSFKDLPTAPAPGLAIAAVPERADARDALCTRDGSGPRRAPRGRPCRHRVTPSPRPARGRCAPTSSSSTSAATSIPGWSASRRPTPTARSMRSCSPPPGSTGSGASPPSTELLSLDSWPTAPAQGALAIETRAGDEHLVARLDHADTRLAVEAERGVLARLEAGCAAPIGAHAFVEDGLLFLSARVYRPDGGAFVTSSHAMAVDADAATDIAARVADELLSLGAADLAPLNPRQEP